MPAGERDLACADHEPTNGGPHAAPGLEKRHPPDSVTTAVVVPIGIGQAGRGLARSAIHAEDTATALFNVERAILHLLDKAQSVRREHDLGGAVNVEAISERLDHVVVMLAGVDG